MAARAASTVFLNALRSGEEIRVRDRQGAGSGVVHYLAELGPRVRRAQRVVVVLALVVVPAARGGLKGRDDVAAIPLPSSPSVPSPQHLTTPPRTTAHE